VGVVLNRKLLLPAIVFAAFWALAITFWLTSGYVQPLLLFGYIGTALAVGLGLYATLPKKKKQHGRRLTLVLVGGLLLVYVGVIERENVQIEWVFFSVLAGLAGAALVHYLIAKVIGPLLFGRLWCGWACWTLMVLDLLPFQRSPGRLHGRWGWLRYGHFALSLGLVAALWWGLGYRDPVHFGSTAGLGWLLAGNGLYYALGVGMAFGLRDNRAFGKYVCPVTVFLKAGSRFSILKIAGDMARCTGCGACDTMCPMDVRILDYVRVGQRVLSTECMLCQTCITVCAEDALRVTVGLDAGGRDRLRRRRTGMARGGASRVHPRR
jgi:ferredoxin-type protein NapH